MKNKGQLKIQQMAFMLMAVTLFFVLAGIFAIVIKTSGLRESATLLEEKNAMLLVSKLANSPEFSCGNAFGGTKLNCIDGDKMLLLKSHISKYQNFWGISNIEIRKISENQIECTLGNYPNCGIIKIREGEIASEYSNFVSLCRKEVFESKVYDKCELAKLMVGYE